MTFDEWWEEFTAEHDEWRYADSEALRRAAFQAGAASRDADVAQLRELLNCYNLGGWTDSARLIKERDQLRAQIKVLREALKESYPWERHFQEKCDCQFCQVLAATEPKS